MQFSHKRSLAIGLNMIEKYLKHMIDDLEGNGARTNSNAKHFSDEIETKTKKEIVDIIKSMLEKISNVRAQFGLEADEELSSRKRQMYGRLIEISTILDDLRPVALKSYGIMASEDEKILNEYIADLRKKTDLMFDVLKKKP